MNPEKVGALLLCIACCCLISAAALVGLKSCLLMSGFCLWRLALLAIKGH